MDAVVREMMNITDEMAATDAQKVKAMRTNVGWFSSPSCALIYQISARNTSPSTRPRATPSARSSSSGSTRSSTARRR
eukprot:2092457-Pleurochrysis_carterae.AAC.1